MQRAELTVVNGSKLRLRGHKVNLQKRTKTSAITLGDERPLGEDKSAWHRKSLGGVALRSFAHVGVAQFPPRMYLLAVQSATNARTRRDLENRAEWGWPC